MSEEQKPVKEKNEGADERDLDCQVCGCPNVASWRCIESGFRYCDTHKKFVGSHGFDKQHLHKWVKIRELTAAQEMMELSRKKLLLCFETQDDRRIASEQRAANIN